MNEFVIICLHCFFTHWGALESLKLGSVCLLRCGVLWSSKNYEFADVSKKRAARLHGTTSHRSEKSGIHSTLGIGGEWVTHCSAIASYLRCPGFKPRIKNWLLRNEAFCDTHQFMQANLVAVHIWNNSQIAVPFHNKK